MLTQKLEIHILETKIFCFPNGISEAYVNNSNFSAIAFYLDDRDRRRPNKMTPRR